MITVGRINIAPVKGLGLSHPDRVSVERTGVVENRRFCLLRPDDGLVSADGWPGGLAARTAYDPATDQLSIRFPDGRLVEGEAVVGGPRVAVDVWGREIGARAVVGEWSAAITEAAGSDLRLMKTEAPGDANDEWPVSIVSDASLERLAEEFGSASPVDGRRFRMLFELAGADAPHVEDSWAGQRVEIGGLVARITEVDARCVITKMNPETGVTDLDTLKAIATYRGAKDGKLAFGMYAEVLEPGEVAVGDAVTPLG